MYTKNLHDESDLYDLDTQELEHEIADAVDHYITSCGSEPNELRLPQLEALSLATSSGMYEVPDLHEGDTFYYTCYHKLPDILLYIVLKVTVDSSLEAGDFFVFDSDPYSQLALPAPEPNDQDLINDLVSRAAKGIKKYMGSNEQKNNTKKKGKKEKKKEEKKENLPVTIIY